MQYENIFRVERIAWSQYFYKFQPTYGCEITAPKSLKSKNNYLKLANASLEGLLRWSYPDQLERYQQFEKYSKNPNTNFFWNGILK